MIKIKRNEDIQNRFEQFNGQDLLSNLNSQESEVDLEGIQETDQATESECIFYYESNNLNIDLEEI